MKKIIMILLLFTVAFPMIADELELGVGFIPGNTNEPDPYNPEQNKGFFEDSLLNLHIGYAFWDIFYASWDGIALPSDLVYNYTSGIDSQNRSGWLNTFDAGIRLNLQPIVLLSEVGLNTLYIEDVADVDFGWNVGANFKLGAGFRTDHLGVTGTLTSMQPSVGRTLDLIGTVFTGTDEEQEAAGQQLFDFTLFSIVFVWYL